MNNFRSFYVSSTKKLDPNLKSLLASSGIKEYRILIKYRNFPDSISKKINSYRGTVIRKIESCNIICAQVKAKSIETIIRVSRSKLYLFRSIPFIMWYEYSCS